MTYRYEQATGKLFSSGGSFLGQGYSGFGPGRNNPTEEAVPDIGPIPKGLYSIGSAHTQPILGPIVMNLLPVGHNALGRTLFRIHGDNATGDASHGCIVLARHIREAISSGTDKEIQVV